LFNTALMVNVKVMLASSLNDANLHNGRNPLTSVLSTTLSFMGVIIKYQCARFKMIP
jgi:hypothetical protein